MTYGRMIYNTCSAFLTLFVITCSSVGAQTLEPVESDSALYVVLFRTGPKWDQTKPAHEQAHFKDHSVNLQRLRKTGALLLGARYSDVGMVILSAPSQEEANAHIESDLSVQAGIFSYELHEFNVFYGGTVERKKK